MEVRLGQRGRSANDFLVSLASLAGTKKDRVKQDFSAANLNDETLADDFPSQNAQVLNAMRDSRAFQFNALVNEWLSTNHGLVAIDAFEEIRSTAEPLLEQMGIGDASLELNEDCPTPDYWLAYDIHRTTGGWDGHEHMGFIHRQIIHKHYVAAKYPWGIMKQRRQVLEELPADRSYQRIFEMGCGTGSYTAALSETFPDSEITACDLSATLLMEAKRYANENSWKWRLLQLPAENTGLASESFDLVTSYVLLHEMPADAIAEAFSESFRLLKPGGVMLMVDARRLSDMNKLDQWATLHRANYGGEPFWAESAALDLGKLAEEVGYTKVKSYGLGESAYPWVTIGEKPDS